MSLELSQLLWLMHWGRSMGFLIITLQKGEEVYIIRVSNDVPEIFNVNMKDAGNFILASQIYLEPADIVYGGCKYHEME